MSRTTLENIDRYPVEIRDFVQKKARSMQAFADIDVVQRRKQAAFAAKQVLNDYGNQRHPKRRFSGPAQIIVESEDGVTFGETFGEKAKRLLFAIENLSVGSVAPDIAGRDANGKRFRLSGFRGQIVVLMFSADWCGPCKAMYPELRQLQDRLREDPFAIVGVMADEKVDTVRSAGETGDITWRVWWDGMKGPIATQWNIDGYPTIVVLDEQGVIRYWDPESVLLPDIVTNLVAAAAGIDAKVHH